MATPPTDIMAARTTAVTVTVVEVTVVMEDMVATVVTDASLPSAGLMSKIEAVIFDCDGTLVDSLPLAAEVLVEHLGSLGLTLSVDEARARFGSGQLAELISDFERAIGSTLPVDFIPEFRRRRDVAVRERLRPMAGALELVSRLEVPVAVASNGPLRQTQLSLEVTGLLQYFPDRVFSAYDVGSWKPDPGLFLYAAERLGVEPAHCAVVEDAVLGIDAGIAAGMAVFALSEENRWKVERVRTFRTLADLGNHLAGCVRGALGEGLSSSTLTFDGER